MSRRSSAGKPAERRRTDFARFRLSVALSANRRSLHRVEDCVHEIAEVKRHVKRTDRLLVRSVPQSSSCLRNVATSTCYAARLHLRKVMSELRATSPHVLNGTT